MVNQNRPLRVAGYARVSRQDQRPGLQADAIKELTERRGWQLVELFLDHGVSGARDRRPALDRMLGAVRRREVDCVVVYRTDRLARSLPHLVTMLADFAALGVKFVSTTEPFDTSVPTGELTVHLVGAFAAFERALLVERTKAGMEAARRRGAKIGRPRVRFDVEAARAQVASGETIAAVARAHGVGATTLRRALAAAPVGDTFPEAA
jgi:DNA invertase Pin-like site-specific DNA recombinase